MASDKTIRVAAILALGIAFTHPLPAEAGTMHQDFVDLLARSSPAESVLGLVMLAEQPNVADLQREMASRGLTSRWRRHQFVLETAQALAARSQVDLLNRLEAWRQEGIVRSYQSYWVTNMVAVEAIAGVFERIAERDDVGTIYVNAELELREGWDDVGVENGEGTRTLPNNLVCVNVEPAWDLGFRGAGRLVADFDTGADGNHPAYASRWRGAQDGVEWWEAWKDPYGNTTFPFDSGTHGTHTLGIMVAEMPDGTAIGVAPEAQWIAAGILIGYNVQRIIECYEWAVDPDGNPGTIEDVPDVINNSWGTSADCDMTYWNAIDIVEAAGIVNTIAVDNTGPGYASVNSPESRAASPTVNWGVGNVNPHIEGYPIATSSGRGPSPCDYVSIKPEVTAPGTQIYATLPGGGYGNKTGTSMACPHTSGAVAILRQVNPDLSVEEIKTALMATAFDRGDPGEDNAYGWGIIDIGAAVDYALQTLPVYPPRNLTALVDGTTVVLTWEAPEIIRQDNPLLKYRIFRAPLDEPFGSEPIGEVSIVQSQPRYEDTGLPEGAYHYVVTAVYLDGESGPSNEAEAYVNAPASTLELQTGPSAGLRASPDPFNPVTVIRYAVRDASPIAVGIYDPSGARIKTLVSSTMPALGEQSVAWDGTDREGRPVASGSYFVRMDQGGRSETRRITLLK